MTPMTLEVERSALQRTRIRPLVEPALKAGQALLRVEKFAITANTVTYAALGSSELRYWDYFPNGDPKFGTVPAWGYAEVVKSRSPGLEEGTRLFGYLPMATHVAIQPTAAVSEGRVVDVSPHRAMLPKGVYDVYSRVQDQNPQEPRTALFRPLFATAFALDEFIASERSAEHTILVSSASSKTAIALAYLMSQRPKRPRVVALTSPANKEFVRRLGCYDDVVSYEQRHETRWQKAVYADFSGDRALRIQIHGSLGDELLQSLVIGSANWRGRGTDREVGGTSTTRFFAPTALLELRRRIGAQEFARRLERGFAAFVDWSSNWLRIRLCLGALETQRAFIRAIEGGTAPDVGVIASLHPEKS